MSPARRDGWWKPIGSPRQHYMCDGRSACGRWTCATDVRHSREPGPEPMCMDCLEQRKGARKRGNNE